MNGTDYFKKLSTGARLMLRDRAIPELGISVTSYYAKCRGAQQWKKPEKKIMLEIIKECNYLPEVLEVEL